MSTPAFTVVVCAAADRPLDWFTASELMDAHDLPSGTPCPHYPVRRRRLIGWFSRWSAHHLIAAVRRNGAVTRTAGGRRNRLDLHLAARQAHRAALIRWRQWHRAVKGTPAARPWTHFLEQHRTDPDEVSYDEAVARFEAQPRVLAMLAYNAHPARPITLDPNELDAYQAGEDTYTVLHWQRAITGDMLVTADGRLLQPTSPTVADRLHYLREASAYLHRFPARGRLLAVRITNP
ncbi:hypothetical protein Q0Z83_039170 [Actinoplanes sichuanensis]|uniref:Uncharacterized protein n=1 Tax=Actinoplanes sichuanensis TaxID=512349 RepID=A0ABW4AT68_9ACTN|nr:hypothetical protein [Actinoplanes sichuanensis]BEL05726.1 hypothetical protein Q0Z83_039170 [Actinoplanes sichuanensis]